jgi:hypothetical protein
VDRPTLPAPDVLTNAAQDFLLRRILFMKPGNPFLEMLSKPKARLRSRLGSLRNIPGR